MRDKGIVKVLPQRTLDEFNIAFYDLNEESHQKIYVQCKRCDEIFLRERRKLHQFHACPEHLIKDVKLKWCNGCKKYLSYKCFTKNESRQDGLNSHCEKCKNSISKDWIKTFLLSKKSKCEICKIPCTITVDDLYDLWANQKGLCYYLNNNLLSADLARLIPSEGYIKGNVVWVSSYDNAPSYDNANVRLECKRDLDKYPQAKLPFRKRVTDAGHDIYAAINVVIPPGQVENVETGLRVSPPDGWYLTVDGRSSLFKEGIVPFRGIIDATYTGPLLISLYNSSDKPFKVNINDRVAQITIHKIHNVDFVEVEDFSPAYKVRGEAGWGSSGRKD